MVKVGRKPADEILKEAEEGDYNLIIMGRKGRSTIRNLILGGVSSTVLQRCHHPNLMPIWWALSLGACLGGNGTMIGASANVVVCGMAEKMGKPISFKKSMRYGMPLMIESVIICHAYIWLRYYVLKI